jgi:tight adherence protein C
MNMLYSIAAISAALMVGSGAFLLRDNSKQTAVAARLQQARHGTRVARGAAVSEARSNRTKSLGLAPLKLVAAIGGGLLRTGLMSEATLAALRHTLTASGMRGANALSLFVGAKILLFAGLPLLVWVAMMQMSPDSPFVYVATGFGACMGLLLPDMAIRKVRARYVARVEAGIADAMDMMVICARAGLALEASMLRVSEEIRYARPEVARELLQTASEIHVASDPREAMLALGTRTGLDGLKRLSVTLVQTMEYGTPLVDALRMLSAEMRTEMLTRAEERAARLPVLLTVPMILFILPCQLIIAAGPAIIHMAAVFSK